MNDHDLETMLKQMPLTEPGKALEQRMDRLFDSPIGRTPLHRRLFKPSAVAALAAILVMGIGLYGVFFNTRVGKHQPRPDQQTAQQRPAKPLPTTDDQQPDPATDRTDNPPVMVVGQLTSELVDLGLVERQGQPPIRELAGQQVEYWWIEQGDTQLLVEYTVPDTQTYYLPQDTY